MNKHKLRVRRIAGIFLIAASLSLFGLREVCSGEEIEKERRTKWVRTGNIIHATLGEVSKDTLPAQKIGQEEIPPCSLKCSFPSPEFEKRDGYDRVYLPGLKSWDGTAGAPILPFKPVRLLIPYGQKAVGVKVTLGQRIEVSGEYLIEPAQEPVPLSQIDKAEPTPPDPAIYESDNVYPSVPCGDTFIQKKHGYTILFLNLFPVEYYPLSGRIAYYPEMSVQVETVPISVATLNYNYNNKKKDHRISIPPNPDVIDEIYPLIDNPKILKTYRVSLESEPSVKLLTREPATPTGDTYEYVIITTNALRDASGEYTFNDLIAAKEARGVTAKLVTVEDDIYPCYSGERPDGDSDDQTKIRNFIVDYYINYSTQYVLLAGDKDNIPIRFFYTSTKPTGIFVFIPADLYYACLDGTFDGNANGQVW